MPVNVELASRNWYRYAFVRDQGHIEYVKKHDKCERYFAGDQWEPKDRQALISVRRPALTINNIISTMSTVMGEQIYNRAETSFLPRKNANPNTALTLAKLFKGVADKNQLEWKRSDMFADGIIGSRGYLDMRMCFDENMQGDIEINKLNPKNVLPDPDADDPDPDTWNEVTLTKWVTPDDIAILFSEADAKYLLGKQESAYPFGYDSIDSLKDRIGAKFNHNNAMYGFDDSANIMRSIRLIERQYRKLDKQLHFVYPKTGETRPVPANWEEERVKYVAREFGLQLIKKLVKRIRWTVSADDVVLHDDWSPYKHFTVIPYFPYFRHGNSIGLVENLIDPQDLLNKSESQNLHIINTSANSGWKARAGALANMSIEELEERGAETGLVVEVNGDPDKDLVKIMPNSVPTGHDRLAYKAEEHMKNISGVPDSARGMDRADVSGKAAQQKKLSSKTNLVKPLDSLARTDYWIGRMFVDLVQEFFTAERVEVITKDYVTNETEEIVLNQVQDSGEVLNDLTVGEFGVKITSVPARETMEDSEFEQLVSMRKDLGVKIKDEHIIAASRLSNKQQIINDLVGDKDSPEAKKQAELAARAQEAAVSKEEGEAAAKHEDAGLRRAKADQLRAETANPEGGTPGLDVHVAGREQGREDAVATRDADRKDAESGAKIRAIEEKTQLQREEAEAKARLAAEAQAQAQADARVQRMTTPKEEA